MIDRRSLLAAGSTRHDIASRLDRGQWVPLLTGIYTTAEALEQARRDEDFRQRLLVEAADRRLGGVVAVGATAARIAGIPLLDTSERVTVARQRGRVGTLHTPLGDVLVRTTGLPSDEVTIVEGLACTTPARTVADLARADFEAGVVAADACLHGSRVTRAELAAVLAAHPTWPGLADLRRVIEFADGRAESPLESLVHIGFAEQGLPTPQLQMPVYDEWQWLVARVDFGWEAHHTVAEADGLLKYRGDDSALVREKQRQERLAELGFEVVRITWRQARSERARTAARVRAAFDRAARSRG